MLHGLSERLSYANVMATIALFVALGGGAYAVNLDNNDVKSKHIKNKQVKDEDIRSNAVQGDEVEDGTLTGDDVDATTFDFHDIPAGGALVAQIADIGAGGSTLFGGPSGRTVADVDVADRYMHAPLGIAPDGLYVHTKDDVPSGSTRTFTVVAYPSVEDGPAFDVLSCEVSPTSSSGNSDNCSDDTPIADYNAAYVVKIVNTGAGLSPTDDAYVGMAMKAPVTPSP